MVNYTINIDTIHKVGEKSLTMQYSMIEIFSGPPAINKVECSICDNK